MSTQPQTPVGGQPDEIREKEAVANVNKVFTTLKITFPAWYEKYYGNQKSEQLAKRIWLTGIRKLTNEQVNEGLQRMIMESDFPPKLKDFMSLSLKLDLLPSLEVAWHEALIGNYSHQVVKKAAQLTGVYELRRATYDDQVLKKRFEYYFSQIISQVVKGESITEVRMALDHSSWLDKLEQEAEQGILERIKEQGITVQNARDKCFLILGKARSKYK